VAPKGSAGYRKEQVLAAKRKNKKGGWRQPFNWSKI